MAMLAESRRKQKWTLNPRGKFWSEDKNKFGQRMLEKMGWSEGKGLGANEQGATSHVAVKVKNDNRGLGSSINDGEWCRHQENFANLLAKFNDTAESDPSGSSLTSLEEISKKSEKRLHYSKFTRGKDLTKYSKKDLDCILGTVGKKEEKPETNDLKEEVGTMDTLYGVITVAGGSVDEYFRKKMKSHSNSSIVEYGLEDDNERSGINLRKRKADFIDLELVVSNDDHCVNKECGDLEILQRKKKKKKSRNVIYDDQAVGSTDQRISEDTNQSIDNDRVVSASSYLSKDLVVLETLNGKGKFDEKVFEENVEEEMKVSEDSEWKSREKKKKKSISLNGDALESGLVIVREKYKKKGPKNISEIGSAGGDCHITKWLREGGSSCLNYSQCARYSEKDIKVVSEEMPEVVGKVTRKVGNGFYSGFEVSEVDLKKKRRKDIDSDDVVCLNEVPLEEEEDGNNKMKNSATVETRRKKNMKSRLSGDKTLGCSDEELSILGENSNSGKRGNDNGAELDCQVVILKKKKKKENKSDSSDDATDLQDGEQSSHSYHSASKKSKTKEKMSSVAEVNGYDEVPSVNALGNLTERVLKENKKDISDVSNCVLDNAVLSVDVMKKNSSLGQLSDKCNGEILSNSVMQGGENLDFVGYYHCLKKKKCELSASEVLHVFHGANLKDVRGYSKK